MTKKQFEALTGKKVSAEEFYAIRQVYNTLHIDKKTFCSEWNRIGDSKLVRELFNTILEISNDSDLNKIRQTLSENLEEMRKTAEFLVVMSHNLDCLSLWYRACHLISIPEVVKFKLTNNIPLNKMEKVFVINNF